MAINTINRMFALIVILLVVTVGVVGDTKSEESLKVKLATAEAARVASDRARSVVEKNNTALQAALLKLASSGSVAAVVTRSSKSVQNNALAAQNDARRSQDIARENENVNRQAMNAQADAANEAQGQALELKAALLSNNRNVMITQLSILIGGFFAFVGTWIVAVRNRRWAKVDTEKARVVAETQSRKLDQIHTLVNSSLTAAMTSELEARQANLALLVEAMELKRGAKQKPSSEAIELIASSRIRVQALIVELNDRNRQTDIAQRTLDNKESTDKRDACINLGL